jgi:uncharacterized protein (DUF58 family)
MAGGRPGTFPLVPHRRFAGFSFGDRRTTRRGQGDEVVGSRPYRPGDHVAWIDWNASARLSAARGSDEFVVREYLAQQAPRVVVVVDRAPSMALYGARLPWLDKAAAASAAATAIGDSTVAARGELAYADHAGGRPLWLPRAGVAELGQRLLDAPPVRGARLELALREVMRHPAALPAGSFVFVVSDYLEPPRPSVWLRLRALRLDVVPVVVQDPVWEQDFPDVSGVVVPFADPADGRVELVRLTRRDARAQAIANRGRLVALLRRFRAAGLDHVLLGSSDASEILAAFRGWAERRRKLARRAA